MVIKPGVSFSTAKSFHTELLTIWINAVRALRYLGIGRSCSGSGCSSCCSCHNFFISINKLTGINVVDWQLLPIVQLWICYKVEADDSVGANWRFPSQANRARCHQFIVDWCRSTWLFKLEIAVEFSAWI